MYELEKQMNDLDTHLRLLGWYYHETSEAKQTYFSKEQSPSVQEGYFFVDKKSKKYSNLDELLQKSKEFFSTRKFSVIEPRNVMNETGNTAFISAGIQNIEAMLFGSKIFEGKMYVLQPCFRTQYFDQQAKDSLKSFVNATTISMNENFSEYLEIIETWIDFFSENGLYAGDFRLKRSIKENDWGTGSFGKLVLDFEYKGLQLGTISFCKNVPTKRFGNISFVDGGFGAERINWAKNKTPDIFNSIELGLRSIFIEKELYDTLRLSSLLVLSGSDKAEKEKKQYFQKSIRKLIEQTKNLYAPEQLILEADMFWTKNATIEREESKEIIEKETLKAIENKLIQKAKMKKMPKQCSTLDELLKFIKQQKTDLFTF